MDPFAIAPRLDQACPLQLGEMPGYLRLDHAQGIGQLADTRIAANEQVKQAQPCSI